MKCRILHETKGRLRVHLCIGRMTLRQADLLEYSMRAVDGVASVKVYDRTQDAVIEYREARSAVLAALSSFSFAAAEEAGLVPEHTGRALNREFEDKLVWKTALHYACKLFLPAYVRAGIAIVRSVRYLKAGLSALLHGKLSVSVLDATAVTVSLVRRDFDTAGSVMFMLRPRRAAGGLDAQKVHRRSGGGHGAERRPRVGARRGRAGAACLREGHPRGRLRRRPYRQHDPARRPRDPAARPW